MAVITAECEEEMNVWNIDEIPKLLKLARRYAKSYVTGEKDLKIAVLGSYSIQHFVSVLRFLLHEEGIDANIYEGEYDGILMDVLNEDSELYQFKPSMVILLPSIKDIKEFPILGSDAESIEQLADKQVKLYQGIWNKLEASLGCQILQANFVLPIERALGNLESNYEYSRSYYYKKINTKLERKRGGNVTIIDMDYWAGVVGKINWFDNSSYYLSKTGFRMDYIGIVAEVFVKQILALTGKVKKCLVLDLDNTLWGGVVGDDGCMGIQLDPNNAIGEAYRAFQQYVLQLKERGVILAVCSKNEEDIAKEPFEKNDKMILKLDDISCFIANWEDKAGNIRTIASKLNIGVDSLVFFDDNPAEREIVKKFVPEVLVVDVPEDPADYVQALSLCMPFEWGQLTGEDFKRTQSYLQNSKRQELESSFVNYDEYLQALDMVGSVEEIDAFSKERFAQLINKSNQFNLRTIRYTEAAIEQMMQEEDTKLLAVSLKDKFSDYGIISCIILKKNGEECFADTWVMSCRVLKRGVEEFAFSHVCDVAREMGCSRLVGEYIPTQKNRMVKDFYPGLGFEKLSENKYVYDLTKVYDKKIWIKEN
ncbi:MAG: HAD family hydrolase [Lachnospiraceae bacterium]|nr:HAD family hydrolase [Lachnospiraceae bacterium]